MISGIARRANRELRRLRRVTVSSAGMNAVRIFGREYRLDEPAAQYALPSGTLRLNLTDAAALMRLAASGLLTGHIARLHVRVTTVPHWLTIGAQPPRLHRASRRLRWRRRGESLAVEFSWSSPRQVHQALDEAVAEVVRARPWNQTCGPAYSRSPSPLVTAVANPYGRVLAGAAARYRLAATPDGLLLQDHAGRGVLRLDHDASPEAAVARTTWQKYAVLTVGTALGGDELTTRSLRALAACGVVFAADSPDVRAQLEALGLVTVPTPDDVEDLPGYALSVEASRRAAVGGDAALRHTALAGMSSLRLPTVSAVVASKRPDDIDACLRYLARQDYPNLEILVGLHGYRVTEQRQQQWRSNLPFPFRVVSLAAEHSFGAVLGHLTRMADGELVTKVDDDDHYGIHHITDLVIAWHTVGVDLVAKGARFVYFPELDRTIDRAWAAPEGFDVSVAGGTLLISRATLQQVGGWSHSSKHVDEDLLTRVREAGGVTYRTHGLEYVYVRRTGGHTFVTDSETLLKQGEKFYGGLAHEVVGGSAEGTTRAR